MARVCHAGYHRGVPDLERPLDAVFLADAVLTTPESWLLPDADLPTALGVRGGRVAAIGSHAEAASWPTRQITRLAGTVLPGFVDSHAHPISVAHHQPEVSLAGLRTIADVQDALRAEAARGEPGTWVFGTDLEPVGDIAGNLSARGLVDAAVGDRPAYVRLFDGHSAIVSSAALSLCDIRGPVPLPEGAEVVCDAAGRPTGELREDPAMALAEAHFPVVPASHITERALEILDTMAACGVTTVQEMDDRGRPWEVLARAERIRPLPVRVVISPVCRPGDTPADWQRLVDLQGLHGARWQVRGVKLFLDGTIENGTAWLHGGDTAGTGRRSVWDGSLATYTEAIGFLDRHGVPTATHAIGDAAVDHALDAIAAAQEARETQWARGTRPSRERAPIHRIEHAETIRPETIGRLARHGVVLGMQPAHVAMFLNADGDDQWSRHLGAERVRAEGYPFDTLRRSGVPVAFGSDFPVAGFDPRLTLVAAVTHRVPGVAAGAPPLPDHRLPFLDAVRSATVVAAQAVGVPGLGTLAPGAVADLVVWSTDAVRACRAHLASGDDAAAVASLAEGAVVTTRVTPR